MSEHKVSAGTMLLFIDPNGGTEYDTVICLKSVSITDSVASIDISSWCGPGKLPGLNDITLSFDGYHIQDPDSLRISGTDLRILLRNKTTIGWKLSAESPVGGDEIQTGIGFIDSLSSTYAFDSVGSFNFTINVKGDVTTIIQPLYYLGMQYGGGTIAWIDETGQHGLIIANLNYQVDQPLDVWSINSSTYFNVTQTDYGYGSNNTNSIVTADSSTSNAAGYCQTLDSGGYTDWFLPTLQELSNIWIVGQIPSVFDYAFIWTSSELTNSNATALLKLDGSENSILKSTPSYILPCRYF